MAEVARVRIVGVPELAVKLRVWAGHVEGGLMKVALAAAQPVVGIVQRLTPVDTGTLRRSIHVEPGHRQGSNAVQQSATVYIGTDVEYAGYVEFGTSRMAAQPYLRPGVIEGREVFVREATRALQILARL